MVTDCLNVSHNSVCFTCNCSECVTLVQEPEQNVFFQMCYQVLFIFSLYRRTSKKDKKTPSPSEEPRPYLHPEYSKAKVIDLDIREIVRLPTGFEHDEWVGSTSESLISRYHVKFMMHCVRVHSDYMNVKTMS